MENFEFYVRTKAIFGKDQIEKLSEILEGYGKNILLTYGGGSIKKIGLYDKVMQLLSEYKVTELAGIEANPKIRSVREGVELCRNNHIDVILAIGGGSVIDCSKAIAAAFYYNGDVFDMLTSQTPIEKAIPIIAVPTMAATGSEMDLGAVVVNPDTNQKVSIFGAAITPEVAIIDPSYTFSVSAKQTAAGCADMMSHLMEQYFLPKTSYLSDLLVESVMKTVIHYARTAMDEPENYEARAQIIWASEIADNATLANGNQMAVFGVHGMEHQISGRFNTTHGEGLAILTPRWMEYVLNKDTATVAPRLAHFAKAVWGLDGSDDLVLANRAIKATENFFRSLDIPMTLTEISVDASGFESMAEQAVMEGVGYAWISLNKEDVINIYRMCK